MKIVDEKPFGIPTNYFTLGYSSTGYILEYSVDGVNWTSIEEATPANETHIISQCPKNLYWRCLNNVGEILVQY